MKRLLLAVVLVGLIGLLAAGLFVAQGWRSLEQPFAGWDGEFVDVILEPGLHAGGMLQRLADHGVLPDTRWPRAWLRFHGGSEELRAGEYRFSERATPLQVLDRLRRGDVLLHGVTIPEGLRLEQVAQRIAEAGFGDVATLLEILRDPAAIHDLDPQAADLEGYLFPDTYHFPRGETAQRIVQRMLDRFREVVGERYSEQAGRLGLELREAVILASMIEAETGVAAERARISRVFHNRIERGMKMQCDPTVLYALHRAQQPVRRLLLRHLEFDSPWNTYRIHGLPIGPIGNPGEASLRAAVQPAEGDELYFVAAPDGGHRFSNSLADHRRAVAAWRAYSRSSK